jgi:hypothetical protein
MRREEISACIIKFDVVNANGRIYTKESIKSIPENLMITLGIDPSPTIKLDSVIGMVDKVDVRDDGVYIAGHLCDTPQRKIFDALETIRPMSFVSFGVGEISKEGNVHDYNLLGVNAIPEGMSSWHE